MATIMEEELIAIPLSEYDFLLSCMQRLIDMHEAEIQRCYAEMKESEVGTIINNAVIGII